MVSLDDPTIDISELGLTATHPHRRTPPLAVAATTGDEANAVRVPLVPIGCWSIGDVRFEFGSSFVRPAIAEDIRSLASLIESIELRLGRRPLASLFGHADAVGQQTFNKALSGRRSAAIYGLLTRRVEIWEDLYCQRGKQAPKLAADDWGSAAIDTILADLGYGDDVGAFQRDHGLDDDGIVGPLTRAELFREYMAKHGRTRDGAPFELAASDFLGRGVADGRGDFHGCGEFNPIVLLSKAESDAANHEARNEANAANRRVLVFLFHPDTNIDPELWPCPRATDGTSRCRKRFWSDADDRLRLGDERREYVATHDTFGCRFYDRLARFSPCEAGIAERLETSFALDEFRGVARMMTKNDFVGWMLFLFGTDVPTTAYVKLRQSLLGGQFRNPRHLIVSGGLQGHLAAYDRDGQTILLDRDFVRRALGDNDAAATLMVALIEEFGHHIDNVLRTELSDTGGDAELDEGARAAYALVKLKQDIQPRTVFATYVTAGVSTELTFDYAEFHAATEKYLAEEFQNQDHRTINLEFFGAGRGNRAHPGGSFGHESIEDALRPVGFDERERELIYFGNWLRDFSQLVDPKITRTSPSARGLTAGFSRKTLTKIVDILAREKFGDRSRFRVSPKRLGVYRPEEHVDNPKHTTGAPPPFRGASTAIETEIDVDFGMKNYIRTVGDDALTFVQQHLEFALLEGPEGDGFTHFGAALHAIEDYYAHSNFVELTLIELGFTQVFPWAKRRVSGGPLHGKFPVVTGTFAAADTAASILHAVADMIEQEKQCKAGERGQGAKIAILLLKDLKSTANFAGKIDAALAQLEELEKKFPKLATLSCKVSTTLFGWCAALVGSMNRVLANQAIRFATDFETDPASTDPTHTQIAKDHDDHPLHPVAAKCAMRAVRFVGAIMRQGWDEPDDSTKLDVYLPRLRAGASALMLHPADNRFRFSSIGKAIRKEIDDWALAHPATVTEVASPDFQIDWMAEAKNHLQEALDEALDFHKKSEELGDLLGELF